MAPVSCPVLSTRAWATGVGAYYLHETHPRSTIPVEDRLPELFKWKWAKYWGQRDEPPHVS
ncbi:hypothetical protein B0H10DRAFT_2237389 [Mycena sp. CBHHK59/15]|nr:hypothetical protein B0H10DRAFT_2237389 [Mycena sp. CBHHK59/15]